MELKEIFVKHNCDKGIKHRYWELYSADFEPIRNNNINILEVGTFKGESTESWLEYFPNAQIYTIDTFERVPPEKLSCLNNTRVEWSKQDSTSTHVNTHFKNLGIMFDIIIDDGLHTPQGQHHTFNQLFKFLKTNGTYYIEDVWMLDRVDLNHPWIKGHKDDFTIEKFNQLIATIEKHNVTYHDFSNKKIPDSYILKVKK